VVGSNKRNSPKVRVVNTRNRPKGLTNTRNWRTNKRNYQKDPYPRGIVERSRFNVECRTNRRNWGAGLRKERARLNHRRLHPIYRTKVPKYIPIKKGPWEALAIARELHPSITKEILCGVGSKLVRCPICKRYELCDRKSTVLACGSCCARNLVVTRADWDTLRERQGV
jgi:hypothetical protein